MSKRGGPLVQALSVAFTVLSMLVLCLSLLLLAMIGRALVRRLAAPRERWYPYRVNLHAASLRSCALVLVLAQAGLWAMRLGEPGAPAYFPAWLLAPFLLLGLLAVPRQPALLAFIAAVEGGMRFPYGPIHGLLVRARLAVFVGAWVCVLVAVTAYHWPGDPVPNIGWIFLLALLLVFPPLLLLNDDWIRRRLARPGKR